MAHELAERQLESEPADQTRADAAGSVPRGSPTGQAGVLALQRSIGNHAVAHLLGRQKSRDSGSEDDDRVDLAKFFSGLKEFLIDEYAADRPLLREAIGDSITKQGIVAVRMAAEEARDELTTLKGNRSDISGVTPELEELTGKIARREKLLAAIDEVLAEFNDYLNLFEAQGLVVITSLLQLSERRILQEKGRYGLRTTTELRQRYSAIEKGVVYDFKTSYSMASNEQSQAMMAAAGELAKKVDAIRADTDAVNKTMGMVPSTASETGVEYGVVNEKAHAEAEKRLHEAYQDYDLLRYEKEAEFPILAAFTPIDRRGGTHAIDSTAEALRRVASGGTQAESSLASDVDQRLEKVQTVREGVADGDIRIWEMPDIVELTKQQLGVKPGSPQARMIDDEVSAAHTWKVAKDILLGVVAIALAVAAAPLTGGASLGFGAAVVAGTAAVAGAGLSTYMAVEHLQEYQLEKAKGGTDFDKARALSQEDPSLFWLALDIVGAVADVKAAITAFKELSIVARAALQARRSATTAEQIARVEGRELGDLRKAAARRLGSAEAGEQVMKSAERAAVGEQAELKGIASKWESELSSDSKALLSDEKVLATWREMDPEVRELLTRCGSVCIPRTVTKAQEARLRKLLNKIPPRHRHGLKEFFYHHRDDLDTAIRDLDQLFSADLGKEVEKAVAALEEGRLPQKEELVSGGRRGTKPADVPDIAGPEAGQRISVELVRKTQNVLGKSIAEAPKAVHEAWEAAAAAAKAELTATNYSELYKAAQREFWRNVRKDPAAMAWFEKNGFNFTTTKTGAPAVAIPHTGRTARKELAIELDHMLPKGTGENWRKALDADNLQFLTGWDNWLLNEIERLSPELARGTP
jgi:hypothetical protein